MNRSPILVEIVRPAALDAPGRVVDTCPADPLVIALVQLVRDRWRVEEADRDARRDGLRLVERGAR
jgi:hypothetical protein